MSARKGSKTVTLSIGSAELTIDKGNIDADGNAVTETVVLDVPAQILSGRTLVPARAISESFGLDVDWDKDEKTVSIKANNDGDETWKENTGTIDLSNLTSTGDGIEIADNQIKITEGGDFTLTGTLTNGNITVSSAEKVKLRLSGASIYSSDGACIYFEDADKAYITITENTENTLTAENSEKGAVYSKDNLEIKGKGTLYVSSPSGHGIKSTGNLTIENGNIDINASSDGIHVDDTFKMSGGNLNITATGDGIESESIVEITGGTIEIKTDGIPTESIEEDKTEENRRGGMWEQSQDVTFEQSSKGIKAEWMMCISGGNITVDAASHAVHCQDEIQIDGGNLSIASQYEKGISAHGNVTINGEDTIINITKSTEGIESKNILTVNDGTINVISSDDALNATGGNSGNAGMPGGNFDMPHENENRDKPENRTDFRIQDTGGTPPNDMRDGGRGNNRFGGMKPNDRPDGNGDMPPAAPDFGDFEPAGNGEFSPPGQMMKPEGGMGMPGGNQNMKDCLVINGGNLELYAEDDCIDSNGNLIINGGTIKASNPNGTFSGPFAVIDPDGKTTIGENATLIFAAGSGDEKNLQLSQNSITVYCEESHTDDTITVKNSKGNVIHQYSPIGKFSSALISSDALKKGETYTITIGNEEYETQISEQNTVIGTKKVGRGGFDKQ